MVTVGDTLFKNYSIGPKKQAYRKVTDLPVKECHQRSKTVMVQAFSSVCRETVDLLEIKNFSKKRTTWAVFVQWEVKSMKGGDAYGCVPMTVGRSESL